MSDIPLYNELAELIADVVPAHLQDKFTNLISIQETKARLDELTRNNYMIADMYFDNEMGFGKLAGDYYEERKIVLESALNPKLSKEQP